MFWVRRPLILIAISMVIANAQCVAACAAAKCGHSNPTSQSKDSANLPPCHRQHAPKQTATPKPCTDSALLVDGRESSAAPASQSAGMSLAALPQAAVYEALVLHTVNRAETASPPDPTRWP